MSPSSKSSWTPINGGITRPTGFRASAISAGLKPSGAPDLALLIAPEKAVCAGTFTQSTFRSGSVILSSERIKNNKANVRAVLINSGQANAGLGDREFSDSYRATEYAAALLNLHKQDVLICSTGVIGKPILIESLIEAMPLLVNRLSTKGGEEASKAILTTDLVNKQIAICSNLGNQKVHIGGMAKGSGMIHPNMATMLGFITCDAAVPDKEWSRIIKKAVDVSFNLISVDGDTSTNDAFIGFAAGELLEEQYFNELEKGVIQVAQFLAKSIARDGEGATCLIEVQVQGAESNYDAGKIARNISSSSLVKTAIHGSDPNWGRIIAAMGKSGISSNWKDLSLWIGTYQLISRGDILAFDETNISEYIQQKKRGKYLIDDTVLIKLVIGNGMGQALAWGCDLSSDYIRINSEYTT